ncbi:MAG: ABC transporter ATP-binding protein [Phycisphaerales bacterium]|nr:ABC transporter ATP-binding protein/permease [Phycisphaerae bacterium]NNF44292.1 ABC transporter ATP-binding protein [Phycisphaerales bacterium]NNM27396.1 ABC transporter ATP-binding protein [Phycisphaerales bacterium]
MSFRPPTSRRRYQEYRRALKAHETEGSRRTAAGHNKEKKKHGRQRSFFDLFAAFWGFLAGSRWPVMIALGTVTVATGLKLIPPAAIGFVLDNVLGDKPLPPLLADLGLPTEPRMLLTTVALVLVIVAAISITVGVSGRYLNTITTKRVQARVRRKVFAHAIRLPLHRVYQLKSGGVASILREDAGGVADLLFSMLYNPWRAIIQLAGTLVILAWIDWRLLVGSLLLLPIVYITHKSWISRIRPIWRDIRASRQQVDGHATEAFGGMRVVRSFGRQRTETGRFLRNNHLMIRQEILAWLASRLIEISWALLIPFASAALLWYGGTRIFNDAELVAAGELLASEALTTGDLVMFLFYCAMLLEPLATLAGSATAFQNSLAGLDRVLDLLDEPVEFPASAGAQLLDAATVEGHVEVRNVTFHYPGTTTPVLEDIDLDARPGEMIALVGSSGAGKTTLCNLIARFYDPTEGSVVLDGTDLRDIHVESYRRLLGVVEQDIFLFDGTIGENIAYGQRAATPEAIAEAAQLAHATEFIERLEKGYETVIGERGVKLSGGQRQRLAIARALLADPKILILDEATSNLDTESERLIQESLERLMRGRTSFVIAHRLSTIAHADRIVVLDRGRIAEEGTHDELMAISGRYRDMVRMQVVGGDGRRSPRANGASHDLTEDEEMRRLGRAPSLLPERTEPE